ncbi:amino acid ABC transporter ATP-binding protein [Mesorhizobium sp. INR15]|uniref:amino acid ABC transporter ATP-binding protein n=1 Tax=Mesorhizobium sp. INR15 TaxID=2654248 RepID=UPI001896598E|nr:amino acid ABC transporter ATP-binding protein [Mesorhizobium sp. INR15]QPC95481.1 ATP-binding cassette domain-containing protein [Mesorhizobium sp. INR15]
MIELAGITKRFGSHVALNAVDLTVSQGEIVVIIGPSGSGKSTLLRCINLLEVPSEGRLTIDQKVIFDRPPGSPKLHFRRMDEIALKARRQSAMVFQRFNLFPHLNVLANVTVGPIKVSRQTRGEAETAARALLEKVGLSAKLDAYPAELSGGQQQRVAIARALAMNPKILLFDEPTSALDPELVGEVLKVIKDIAHDGVTKVIVTHEMGFAREIADRVVMVDHGRILEVGKPAEIFTRPRTERAQAFLRCLFEREATLKEVVS